MKPAPLRPRAALLIGAALLTTPAVAQDAPTQTVTPPPIMANPAPAAAPAAQPQRVIEMAPASPVVQPAPPPGPVPGTEVMPRAERQASRAAPAREARSAPARQAAPAPAAAAPAAAPAAQTPVAQTPAPVAELAAPVAAAPEAAAPAPAQETTVTQTETSNGTGFAWPWLLGGVLLVIAGIAAMLLMRRRRDEDVVEETVYEEPVVAPRAYEAPVAAAPVAAAPVIEPRHEPEVSPFMAATAAAAPAAIASETGDAHVEAELAEPESGDLAGVTDAPAPVSNRPWLEFGLRPVRAGTSEEEALVDVELTVGNAGDVPARDVRISTFMLADADGSEMESLLTGRGPDAAVPPVTIAPGDGTRVDAHLAVPKGEMGRVFNPVVVAEARYTLPDGSEGRTSAAFKIGRPSAIEPGVGPIGATRPHMVDNVEAELLGAPEHA
ncbi:hypothetical protein RZN05_01960 [Sphingomonas sp. HF-S4]|uniref:LPXTG cell wall anchor domain-containing protein n=1 Tax=Sphingomonas agrestis TaxID=3080540 RepID=A0ABU3Y2X0_9SPHN|nr:hypothetical protein [Sphingomonas sp. HF-S4]MDV3455733.1 hypothetical protein [Sphingomonas sp. HF-S4]